jgi:hypothetical protein
MLKPPKNLRSTLLEALGSGLILLLVLPIIFIALIAFVPYILVSLLWSWLRKEPKPTIPDVINDANLTSEQIATQCTVKAKGLVENVVIKNDKNSLKYVLTSPALGKRTITFSYERWGMAVDIDDLNCYNWNTAESDDIDLFYWIAIGALRSGVYPARSRLGRMGYWIKSEEMGVWVKVQRAGTSYDGIGFYNAPPEKVKALIQLSTRD